MGLIDSAFIKLCQLHYDVLLYRGWMDYDVTPPLWCFWWRWDGCFILGSSRQFFFIFCCFERLSRTVPVALSISDHCGIQMYLELVSRPWTIHMTKNVVSTVRPRTCRFLRAQSTWQKRVKIVNNRVVSHYPSRSVVRNAFGSRLAAAECTHLKWAWLVKSCKRVKCRLRVRADLSY